ncbi:FecR family protein [Flavobacterium sp.]|uniref:FecR family protein n=1 Tax=Flavobacterium sp. TaxID=239 RepID=UPI0026138CEC|nr:FecR family protein [Flavobacterium sp.]MDD3005351.1 FecR family protein [Flavobacterium sp.]
MEEKYQLAKWLAGEMSATELKAFQETAEYDTYIKIIQFSDNLNTPSFDKDKMYQNIIATPKKSKPKVVSFYTSKWLQIAALLVVFLSLTLVVKSNISFTEYAKNKQKINFTLPDDSEIVLNAGSEINYKKWNWNNQRSLTLKGEAFFKVAKGKTFDVKTDLGTVTVVGTQFNVKSREKRMEVRCFEGKVKVQNKEHISYIQKGETVIFEKNQQTIIPFHASAPAWLDNQIHFESENLDAIKAEIERQYDITMVIKNVNFQQKFTGTIPSNDLDVALKIISKTFHLHITKTNDTLILEGK